jgi:hypothetical protein
MCVRIKVPKKEFLEPSATKKYGSLPSWERYIENIDTVERAEGDELFIYFLQREMSNCQLLGFSSYAL